MNMNLISIAPPNATAVLRQRDGHPGVILKKWPGGAVSGKIPNGALVSGLPYHSCGSALVRMAGSPLYMDGWCQQSNMLTPLHMATTAPLVARMPLRAQSPVASSCFSQSVSPTRHSNRRQRRTLLRSHSHPLRPVLQTQHSRSALQTLQDNANLQAHHRLAASETQQRVCKPSSNILPVDSKGGVNRGDLDSYIRHRREEVGKRLQACLDSSSVARRWFDELSEKDLYDEKDGEAKYLGDKSVEESAKAAVARAKATADPVEMVSAVEDLVLNFCGFSCMKPSKAVCLVNALHFQYTVDVDRLLSTPLSLPSDAGDPTDAEKALFDEASVGAAELLLRCVVETSDGGLLANAFSPGPPMGKLLKLPLFAQLVMVLTNAVEAVWYEEAVPTCPMGINVYASLLVAEAPVLQMVGGVSVVEIMEMTKGAKRGPEVDEWVGRIRESGATVLLDDFDAKHPGLGSKPNGIKACVFVNAHHSLQAFKNEAVGDSSAPLLPITELPMVEKDDVNPFNMVDYYGSLVPKHQSGTQILVMEGSENCLKSETQGPPFNFGERRATTASAHVYQAAAKSLCANKTAGQLFQMLHQGGRALYDDEDFDEDALAMIAASGKQMAAARTSDAGTISWMGSEAVRRASMQQRPLVCGVVKKASQL